jgi:hypothetical protein
LKQVVSRTSDPMLKQQFEGMIGEMEKELK